MVSTSTQLNTETGQTSTMALAVNHTTPPFNIRVTSDMCPRWIAAKYTIEANPVRKKTGILVSVPYRRLGLVVKLRADGST